MSMLSPRCRPLIFCGPSGAGKSTLVRLLTEEYEDQFGFSVSHTTRAPRAGEEHGKAYWFVTVPEMEKEIEEGKFIEYARVHGNIYGTSKKAVDDVSTEGRICILDIDIQGVKTCKSIGLDVGKYVWIAPPSIDELKRRLESRGTETTESMALRLENASKEIEAAKDVEWDHQIVNDDLMAAYAALKEAVLPLQLERAASLGEMSFEAAREAAAAASP